MDNRPRLTVSPDHLLAVRLKRLMSQEDLAYKSGLSVGTIKSFEQTRKGARPATVKALAEALDCDPFDIAEVGREEVAS